MLKRILISALVALAATTVSAQAATGQTPAARTVDITVGETGREIPVREGDVLRFTLGGSAGTGYSWLALEVDPAYLTLIDRTTVKPAAGPVPLPGGPGPATVYRYFVRATPRQGGAALSIPLMFAHVPPGRGGKVTTDLVRFDLTPR